MRLEPLTVAHAAGLFGVFAEDAGGRGWTYLPRGPFTDLADAEAWAATAEQSRDPLYFAICAPDGTPLGFCSYLRIDPANGVIEVGFIHLSPRLQRTAAAISIEIGAANADAGLAQFENRFKNHLLSLRACITRDIREVKKMQARLLKDMYKGEMKSASINAWMRLSQHKISIANKLQTIPKREV